jgi:hypothetical protein
MLNVIILNVIMLSVLVERTTAVTVMGIFEGCAVGIFTGIFVGIFLQLVLMILEWQVTNTVAYCSKPSITKISFVKFDPWKKPYNHSI